MLYTFIWPAYTGRSTLGAVCKLYDVSSVQQILANRAIAHSRLGDVQEARDDFLTSLQSKVEPRHSIIEDSLLCWQVSRHAYSLDSVLRLNLQCIIRVDLITNDSCFTIKIVHIKQCIAQIMIKTGSILSVIETSSQVN